MRSPSLSRTPCTSYRRHGDFCSGCRGGVIGDLTDLARELDAALHPDGPPITGPVTPAVWGSLLAEVRLQGAVARSRAAQDEELARRIIEGGPPDARR